MLGYALSTDAFMDSEALMGGFGTRECGLAVEARLPWELGGMVCWHIRSKPKHERRM